MTHAVKQIRDAVKDRLKAACAFAGVHGMARLQEEFQDHELPAACVDVTESVTLASGSLGPGNNVYERGLTVMVKIATRDTDDEDAEETIDGLRTAVEKALLKPSGLGLDVKVDRWTFMGSSGLGIQEAGDGWLVARNMTWSCAIRTLDADPETII